MEFLPLIIIVVLIVWPLFRYCSGKLCYDVGEQCPKSHKKKKTKDKSNEQNELFLEGSIFNQINSYQENNE